MLLLLAMLLLQIGNEEAKGVCSRDVVRRVLLMLSILLQMLLLLRLEVSKKNSCCCCFNLMLSNAYVAVVAVVRKQRKCEGTVW